MAAEPINIFSHRQDLAGISTLLRRLVPGAKLTGRDNAWERITVEGAKNRLGKCSTLVFKNFPEYYSGPGWPKQIAGMQGYFSRFPAVPRTAEIFQVIRNFRFALATEFEPDLHLHSNDPRLQFLFLVTRHLDGVIFTPSGLWDANGRPLLCADGRSEPTAVLPAVPEIVAQSVPRPEGETAVSAEEEVEAETAPPEAQRVAHRAVCLAAVSARGLLEAEKLPANVLVPTEIPRR